MSQTIKIHQLKQPTIWKIKVLTPKDTTNENSAEYDLTSDENEMLFYNWLNLTIILEVYFDTVTFVVVISLYLGVLIMRHYLALWRFNFRTYWFRTNYITSFGRLTLQTLKRIPHSIFAICFCFFVKTGSSFRTQN